MKSDQIISIEVKITTLNEQNKQETDSLTWPNPELCKEGLADGKSLKDVVRNFFGEV